MFLRFSLVLKMFLCILSLFLLSCDKHPSGQNGENASTQAPGNGGKSSPLDEIEKKLDGDLEEDQSEYDEDEEDLEIDEEFEQPDNGEFGFDDPPEPEKPRVVVTAEPTPEPVYGTRSSLAEDDESESSFMDHIDGAKGPLF